jgi:hypothetical protein
LVLQLIRRVSALSRSQRAFLIIGLFLGASVLALSLRPREHAPSSRPDGPVTAVIPAPQAQPVAAVAPAAQEEPEDLRELTILAQKKRIMGRKASLPSVERIATVIGPLVARALEQPAVQDDLRALARSAGMSVSEYKDFWKRKQEADLLLEAGGDPNARSVADAIGVAQWLASTGRAMGLRVDVGASRRLTGKLYQLQAKIDALQQRPETWSAPGPAGSPAPRLIAAAPGRTDADLGPLAAKTQPQRTHSAQRDSASEPRGEKDPLASGEAPAAANPSSPKPDRGESTPSSPADQSAQPAAGSPPATSPAPDAEPKGGIDAGHGAPNRDGLPTENT